MGAFSWAGASRSSSEQRHQSDQPIRTDAGQEARSPLRAIRDLMLIVNTAGCRPKDPGSSDGMRGFSELRRCAERGNQRLAARNRALRTGYGP